MIQLLVAPTTKCVSVSFHVQKIQVVPMKTYCNDTLNTSQ